MDDEFRKKTMETFQISDDDMLQEEKKPHTGEIIYDEVGQKFYIDFGDEEAVIGFTRINDVLNLHHTFVPDKLRGQGIGEKIAIFAFEFAKKNHLKIYPTCPYIKDKFLPKHSEYESIVVEGYA